MKRKLKNGDKIQVQVKKGSKSPSWIDPDKVYDAVVVDDWDAPKYGISFDILNENIHANMRCSSHLNDGDWKILRKVKP